MGQARQRDNPRMTNPRAATSLETAVLMANCDALLRLIAVMATFMIWYSLAFAGASLYLSMPGRLEFVIQALATAGLVPIPLIAATWKGIEWLLVQWLTAYLQRHVETQ